MSYLMCPHCKERMDVFSYRRRQAHGAKHAREFPGRDCRSIRGAGRRRYRAGRSPCATATRMRNVFRELAKKTIERPDSQQIGPPVGTED